MVVSLFDWFRRLRNEPPPLPEDWGAIVSRNVAAVRGWDIARQETLGRLASELIKQKNFEGAHDLDVTHEMRVTIAANACLLLMGWDEVVFPRLKTIIVYPGTYYAQGERRTPEGTVLELHEVRRGESWTHGTLVLSWGDVLADSRAPEKGRNVVLHEFAHQLDSEDGEAEGIPYVGGDDRRRRWLKIMQNAQRKALRQGWSGLFRGRVIDPPAEFLAVSVELFFLWPDHLRARFPQWYEALASYFQQRPHRPARRIADA
jgi:Mlc titration factor MtfA (ptsG expression regulator)